MIPREDIIATKIRALYQRSKGRDLHEKLEDNQFTADITSLIRRDTPEYDVQNAGVYIEKVLLSKL